MEDMVRYAQNIARAIRLDVLEMIYSSQSSHISACYSVADILAVLVNLIDLKEDLSGDILILSKGHAAAALYAALVERGLAPKEILTSYCVDGGILPGHPKLGCMPGVHASTGSLGHGLAIGAGYALAAKLLQKKKMVYVILGDGECNEGSVWESANFIAARKLGNVVVIVDKNGWQGFCRTNETLGDGSLEGRWASFGWQIEVIDGHNVEEIISSLQTDPQGDKPKAIIAKTIKGKGVSFMEDKLEWHYRSPRETEYRQAKMELENR